MLIALCQVPCALCLSAQRGQHFLLLYEEVDCGGVILGSHGHESNCESFGSGKGLHNGVQGEQAVILLELDVRCAYSYGY